MRSVGCILATVTSLLLGAQALAAEVPISYQQALEHAGRLSPDIAAARAREAAARAEVGIAGVLPNPSISAGTSTQAAKLSLGVSLPLVVFGQRAASVEASRADLVTTRVETEIAAADVRAAAGHAYVSLWRAQGIAEEQARAAAVARDLDEAVAGRVELGAAASVDGLRSHAERLRADASAQQASQLVAAAGSELGRWLGVDDGAALRAIDAPPVPSQPPALADLRSSVEGSPSLRRERADETAAEARAARERSLVRPILLVDLGMDAWDPTLCPNGPCNNPPVNYRGGLGLEVPLLAQRGYYVERERANAAAARSRETADRLRLVSAVTSAFRTFEAWTANARALADGVVPAAGAAAAAARESYGLGRAPLVAVLDAEKARIEAALSLIDSRAQRADAWIEVEHAVGTL
jgi:cobalt-zinc-cadmium efflux system outer membrane protein